MKSEAIHPGSSSAKLSLINDSFCNPVSQFLVGLLTSINVNVLGVQWHSLCFWERFLQHFFVLWNFTFLSESMFWDRSLYSQ